MHSLAGKSTQRAAPKDSDVLRATIMLNASIRSIRSGLNPLEADPIAALEAQLSTGSGTGTGYEVKTPLGTQDELASGQLKMKRIAPVGASSTVQVPPKSGRLAKAPPPSNRSMKPMNWLSSWSPKLQGRAVANMLIGLPAKGRLVPGIRRAARGRLLHAVDQRTDRHPAVAAWAERGPPHSWQSLTLRSQVRAFGVHSQTQKPSMQLWLEPEQTPTIGRLGPAQS